MDSCVVRTNAAVLDNSDKPPVRVAVIKKHHRITLSGVGLSFNGRNEGVQGVDEFEVDVLYFT
jgi:hypothetical protein